VERSYVRVREGKEHRTGQRLAPAIG